MGKRPTPKKRRAKSDGNRHQAMYERKQLKKLHNKLNSPFCRVAAPKDKAGKALKGITRIKA
jgi:hypothetical protein